MIEQKLDNELISIIIPAYNIQDYLGECLNSILDQTYRNWEAIVIDDGSSDETGKIADSYSERDSRIHVYHQVNSGVTSARIHGLQKASGDWIGFVDGDDYIDSDMYERLLFNAIRSQSDISHCGYQMVFPSRIDYYYNTGRIIHEDNRTALISLLKGRTEPGLWNKIYHRSLLRDIIQNNIIDPAIRINEDLLMNFYLFRKAKCSVFEDRCFYHYRVRTGSAANSSLTAYKLIDPLTVRKRIVQETKDDNELYGISLEILAINCIRISTMNKENQSDEIGKCIYEASKELKQIIPEMTKNQYCSRKTLIQASWASIWPASYRWIHHVYGELSGVNHKYDVK